MTNGVNGRSSASIFRELRVREVVLTARSQTLDLAVVRYESGGWGITRRGQIVDEWYWPDVMLDGCIETFLLLAGQPALPSVN
jgi:hypothetical protein